MDKSKITELVIKAQKGDKEALSELMAECYNDSYYYVLKTVKNEDLAADVTQESFIEIINTIDKLREPEAFFVWARRIAYHKSALHFRNTKEVLFEENEDGETILDSLPEENIDELPEQFIENKEFCEIIMEMINSLPSEQTNALLLYYYEKMSVKDIAEIQGTTEGTVKSRLNYARKAIKGKVEKYEETSGIKLHSVAIIPLLLSLAFAAEKVAMPLVSVPASVATAGAGAAAATAGTGACAGAGAAATTATVATKSVGTFLSVKIISSVVAASLAIGGVVFGISKFSGEKPKKDNDSISSATQSEIDKEPEDIDRYSELTPSKGLKFEVDDYDCTVVGFGTCTDTEIVIPAEYDGKPVTGISSGAFRKRNRFDDNSYVDIIKIHLPKTISRIGNRAFWGCESLEEVHIYSTETIYVEEYAFWECYSLKYIDLTKVSMGEKYVFSDCVSLQEFSINDGVQIIGYGFLNECTSLKSLTIPASVTHIPVNMCRQCVNLKDIYYGGTVEQWTKVIQNYVVGKYRQPETSYEWHNESGEFTIHCTDGDIEKNDAVVYGDNTVLGPINLNQKVCPLKGIWKKVQETEDVESEYFVMDDLGNITWYKPDCDAAVKYTLRTNLKKIILDGTDYSLLYITESGEFKNFYFNHIGGHYTLEEQVPYDITGEFFTRYTMAYFYRETDFVDYDVIELTPENVTDYIEYYEDFSYNKSAFGEINNICNCYGDVRFKEGLGAPSYAVGELSYIVKNKYVTFDPIEGKTSIGYTVEPFGSEGTDFVKFSGKGTYLLDADIEYENIKWDDNDGTTPLVTKCLFKEVTGATEIFGRVYVPKNWNK